MAIPDLIGIVARDVPASLDFYRLPGLSIAAGAEADGHVEVVLAGGFRDVWDSLESVRGIYPDWSEPVGYRMTLAFRSASQAEVDALHEKVLAAGYRGHKLPWDAVWGQRYAVVVDPDDNLVDAYAVL